MEKKMPDLDVNLVLKSLVYFKDLICEPIKFKHGRNINLELIKKFFKAELGRI
jgi:hypothetical protein